jgi:dTDP-4-dehydrorhamnose 3,5-epimerase
MAYIEAPAPLPPDDAIIGVKFKLLKTHPDPRGYFREVIRVTDSVFGDGHFAQWSHSRMQKDVVKAWHYHHIQDDWWYVPIGEIQTVLIDYREESPTFKTKLSFKMGDSPESHQICVRIPPGVLHGCRVFSTEAHLFYITSEIYNPQDEGRIPFDSPLVKHNWGANALTAENDRRTFAPVNARTRLAKS